MPKKVKSTFAADLLRLRGERDLRQVDVARALGVTGALVCQWEKGYDVKDEDRRRRILDAVAALPSADDVVGLARHAKMARLARAIDAVVDAAEDIDDEWVESWLESARAFRDKVRENVRS